MQVTAPKTPRGVQEADVWAAADALLAQGHKPTIEKVRMHMGRGSPNTVAPMLDAWFSTLGARLGLNQQTQELRNSVPTEVLEAAQSLWSHALQHAQEVAQQTLETRERAAAESETKLEALKSRLQQREEGLQQQRNAMDAALKLAQAQREDLSRRLDEMQQQLTERDQWLEKQREEILEQRKANEALREQHSRELDAAAQERQRLAEQFAGNERRMLADLDRSRQEGEKARKQQLESERVAAARYEELYNRHQGSEEELLNARAAQINLQQALDMANERVQELKGLLQQAKSLQTLELQSNGADTTADKLRSSRSLQRRALTQRALRLPRK
ncbi:DNA-binding protein [Comamonas sp. NoAH]|uniref:DNA-binding protein n=1 Tax=Comamonas halotolerans TaxID=3041496 RepID=UPI0024E0C50B|nr:DNA-binding protein [Comamonas sp. NoAH]